MVTRTNTRRTYKTTKRTSSPRRAMRGIKGGESTVNKIEKEVQKQAAPMFQKYADQTLKVANKMGLKGGAAVMAGGAAGVIVGAALGGIAAAAMSTIRTARIANETRSTAESISKHAEDIKNSLKRR